MKKQKTIYHMILDKSGSMSDCIPNTLEGYNEQILKIRELEKKYPEQEICLGLTTFNHEICHLSFHRPPSTARLLNNENYRPDGTTALLDAIGLVIRQLEKDVEAQLSEFDTTVVVVILTDGHENASRQFRLSDISQMISRLEETGKWTFSFIGATLDAVHVAQSMAIKTQNSYTFDKAEMKGRVFENLSRSMDTYFDKKRKGGDLGKLFED
jgi:hypothetical protein